MNPQEQWNIFYREDWNLHFQKKGFLLLDASLDLDYPTLERIFHKSEAYYQAGFFATILSQDQPHRQEIHEAVKKQVAHFVDRYFKAYRQVICGFAVKQAQPESAMPLHQDISMHPGDQRPGLSLWIPLIDTNSTNGYLQLLAGSHLLYPDSRAAGTPFPASRYEAFIRQHLLTSIPIPKGQAIVFDQRLFHASPPNTSGQVRPVATSVLIPKEAPLHYYHRNGSQEPVALEEYEVEEDFFLQHQIGSPPQNQKYLRTFPETPTSISLEDLKLLAN